MSHLLEISTKLPDQSCAFTMHHTMFFLCVSTRRLNLQRSHGHLRSNGTHSTKVSEVPSPRARASDSSLKCLFLSTGTCYIKCTVYGYDIVSLQHSDSFILSFAHGTLGIVAVIGRLSKFCVIRSILSTSNSSNCSNLST